MENNYRKLIERIPAPAGLEARVLLAARQQEAEKAGPKRLAKRNWTPVLRGLACAACALALAVGTVSVRPAGNGGNNRRAGTEHIILFCKFNYLFHGLIIIVVRVYLVN